MSEQNNQGFRGIPGVPDGWELVAIRVPKAGEWFVGVDGKPFQAEHACGQQWTIIRKIEKPKQWRPFANAVEYVAHRRNGIAVDWKSPDRPGGFYAIVSANDSFVWVAFGTVVEQFDWAGAFERLHFRHITGSTSPFGVEVTQ